jgi:hypothetical protein
MRLGLGEPRNLPLKSAMLAGTAQLALSASATRALRPRRGPPWVCVLINQMSGRLQPLSRSDEPAAIAKIAAANQFARFPCLDGPARESAGRRHVARIRLHQSHQLASLELLEIRARAV